MRHHRRFLTRSTYNATVTAGAVSPTCHSRPSGGHSDPWGCSGSPANPTVTTVSPSAGPLAGGTSVTVNGTNLTGATAVNFGATAGTGVVVDGGGTSLTVTSPAEAAGTVDVTVVTPAGIIRHQRVR